MVKAQGFLNKAQLWVPSLQPLVSFPGITIIGNWQAQSLWQVYLNLKQMVLMSIK